VARLFDDDEDVEVVSSTRSHSRRHSASSGASRPPTSESEGMFDGRYVDDEDDAEELPAKIPRSSKQRSTRVGQSKRDAALKSEVRLLFKSSLF